MGAPGRGQREPRPLRFLCCRIEEVWKQPENFGKHRVWMGWREGGDREGGRGGCPRLHVMLRDELSQPRSGAGGGSGPREALLMSSCPWDVLLSPWDLLLSLGCPPTPASCPGDTLLSQGFWPQGHPLVLASHPGDILLSPHPILGISSCPRGHPPCPQVLPVSKSGGVEHPLPSGAAGHSSLGTSCDSRNRGQDPTSVPSCPQPGAAPPVPSLGVPGRGRWGRAVLSAVIVTSSRGSGRSRWHQSHPRHVTLGTSHHHHCHCHPPAMGTRTDQGRDQEGRGTRRGWSSTKVGVGSLSPLPHGGPQERGHPPCDLSGDRGAESPRGSRAESSPGARGPDVAVSDQEPRGQTGTNRGARGVWGAKLEEERGKRGHGGQNRAGTRVWGPEQGGDGDLGTFL